MDELLQKAIERREQLRIELEALDHFIRSLVDAKERQAPKGGRSVDLFSLPKSQNSRRARAVETAAAMDAAEKLILGAGRPLTRTTLLKGLEELGHYVDGKDKSKVLGTNLWRSKRFHNLKRVGYWPINSPIPEKFKHVSPRESMLLRSPNY